VIKALKEQDPRNSRRDVRHPIQEAGRQHEGPRLHREGRRAQEQEIEKLAGPEVMGEAPNACSRPRGLRKGAPQDRRTSGATDRRDDRRQERPMMERREAPRGTSRRATHRAANPRAREAPAMERREEPKKRGSSDACEAGPRGRRGRPRRRQEPQREQSVYYKGILDGSRAASSDPPRPETRGPEGDRRAGLAEILKNTKDGRRAVVLRRRDHAAPSRHRGGKKIKTVVGAKLGNITTRTAPAGRGPDQGRPPLAPSAISFFSRHTSPRRVVPNSLWLRTSGRHRANRPASAHTGVPDHEDASTSVWDALGRRRANVARGVRGPQPTVN